MNSPSVSKVIAVVLIVLIIALFVGLILGKVDPLTFFIIAGLMYAYTKWKKKT